MVELTVSFRGLDADNGHLDALSGIESAVGVARALTLIGHYAATGNIRHRFPFDSGVKFYLEGTEEGSFNWRLTATIVGPLALGLATNGIYDLSKLVIARAIGMEATGVSQQVEALDKDKGGDINALVEAVEPALKKAHYGIGQTASEIVIEETSNKRSIIKFDHASKEYLSANIPSHDDIQDVSISALNVNDRTGRAYFLDLHRTIPFLFQRTLTHEQLPHCPQGFVVMRPTTPRPLALYFLELKRRTGASKRSSS